MQKGTRDWVVCWSLVLVHVFMYFHLTFFCLFSYHFHSLISILCNQVMFFSLFQKKRLWQLLQQPLGDLGHFDMTYSALLKHLDPKQGIGSFSPQEEAMWLYHTVWPSPITYVKRASSCTVEQPVMEILGFFSLLWPPSLKLYLPGSKADHTPAPYLQWSLGQVC